MLEIIPTHFEHPSDVKVAPNVVPKSPYTLFEPHVERVGANGSVEVLDAQQVLDQMKQYSLDRGFKPPYTYMMGSEGGDTVGSVLDTEASEILEEVDGIISSPEALRGILTSVARVAVQSGFDREKAVFCANFLYPSNENNANLTLHSDGLSGNVKSDTESAKVVRFVYALGPGTLLYPSLDKEGHSVEEGSPEEGVVSLSPESIDPIRAINAARGTEVTQEELERSDEQQVMPGCILGFDPTRTLWHKAPGGEERPILVIDIAEVESPSA